MPRSKKNLNENDVMILSSHHDSDETTHFYQYERNIDSYGSIVQDSQNVQQSNSLTYFDNQESKFPDSGYKISSNQTWKRNWLAPVSVGLGMIGAVGAGGTTVLLHNTRKISQIWNLGNAGLRFVLGTAFTLSTDVSLSRKVSSAVWKIVSNGSYIVTTLDVNKEVTIFSTNYNYEWNQFPNPKPFVAFEISAWSGFLSGIIDLIQLFCTNENSPFHKILERVQKVLDFVCPSAAAVGGAFLFWVKGLDSTTVAPILCTADGSAGTINYFLNLFFNKAVNNHFQAPENFDIQNNSSLISSLEEEASKSSRQISSPVEIPISNTNTTLSFNSFKEASKSVPVVNKAQNITKDPWLSINSAEQKVLIPAKQKSWFKKDKNSGVVSSSRTLKL